MPEKAYRGDFKSEFSDSEIVRLREQAVRCIELPRATPELQPDPDRRLGWGAQRHSSGAGPVYILAASPGANGLN
jgi:hypothetical protein